MRQRQRLTDDPEQDRRYKIPPLLKSFSRHMTGTGSCCWWVTLIVERSITVQAIFATETFSLWNKTVQAVRELNRLYLLISRICWQGLFFCYSYRSCATWSWLHSNRKDCMVFDDAFAQQRTPFVCIPVYSSLTNCRRMELEDVWQYMAIGRDFQSNWCRRNRNLASRVYSHVECWCSQTHWEGHTQAVYSSRQFMSNRRSLMHSSVGNGETKVHHWLWYWWMEWAGWYVRSTAATLQCHQENNGLLQQTCDTFISAGIVILYKESHTDPKLSLLEFRMLFLVSCLVTLIPVKKRPNLNAFCAWLADTYHQWFSLSQMPPKLAQLDVAVSAIRNWSKLRAGTVARNVHLNQDCVSTIVLNFTIQ